MLACIVKTSFPNKKLLGKECDFRKISVAAYDEGMVSCPIMKPGMRFLMFRSFCPLSPHPPLLVLFII